MPDFNRLNPYTTLVYFVCTVFFSIVFTHPLFVAVNGLLSFCARLCLCRKEILSLARYTIFMAAAITFLNPLFSTGGERVLFRIFGRPYTFQALVYGAVLGGIFLCSVNWFCCLGRALSADRFIYIFGGKFPRLCTMLSTVLTLLPYFSGKLREISGTQNNIIPHSERKIKGYFRCFSTAASYAFERAIFLALSMKNRGFSSGDTTRYLDYGFKKADLVTIFSSLALSAAVLFTAYPQGVGAQLIPHILLPKMGVAERAGFVCFAALLSIPSVFKIVSEIKWIYLKSKI